MGIGPPALWNLRASNVARYRENVRGDDDDDGEWQATNPVVLALSIYRHFILPISSDTQGTPLYVEPVASRRIPGAVVGG